VSFEPLDNGFSSCEDPKKLQQICDCLSAAKIDKLVRKWLAILPHPSPGPTAVLATATTSPS
jgi:hypothetical protein